MRSIGFLAALFISTASLFAQIASTRPATTMPVSGVPATTQAADSPEQATIDFLVWIERVKAVLEYVKDRESAEAAAVILEQEPAKVKALVDRMTKLMASPIDPAVLQALQDKYGTQAQDSMAKLQAERQRIYRDPALKELISPHLDAAMQSFPTAQPVD